MASALSFIPEPGFEQESLISTAEGANEGQTLLFVGVGDLKNEIRLHAYGVIDEDPIQTRRFYFPENGALREIDVIRADEVVSEGGTTAVFEGRTRAAGLFVCRFEVRISHD